MPAACRPSPDVASPVNDKRRKVEHSPYAPPHAYAYAPPMTNSPNQGVHYPSSPYYPPPDLYSYPMPPPGHYGPPMPPPHPHATASYPPRPHLPPRFNHQHQHDSYYTSMVGKKQPSSPGVESNNEPFRSPNTSTSGTTLDTRSPEGSRNDLTNFEERVSSNGNPPPSYSPSSAQAMHHPYMPPPIGYHPGYPPPPPHYAHPHYHSTHAPCGWACDYCSCKFNNWEECSAHEETCTAKNYYDGRDPDRNAKGRKMKHISYPADFYMDDNAEYAVNDDRETYLLATAKDGEYLSNRQCYVRTHFVEIFISNKADMAARHSRGAQKLNENQVGLRCAYCVRLKPRDRAERAICYPSSISRIYQTVADMQRFHFEACIAIPPKVLAEYKSLKTTRPRGVGSPQGYWEKSARDIGLADSSLGIQIGEEGGMDLLMLQKKGTTGILGSVVATSQPMSELTLAPASPEIYQDEEMVQEAAVSTASVSLPVVSSPASPGSPGAASVDTPITPVIPGVNVVTAPLQETREADANILLMLKKTTESPTENDEDSGFEQLPYSGTVPV